MKALERLHRHPSVPCLCPMRLVPTMGCPILMNQIFNNYPRCGLLVDWFFCIVFLHSRQRKHISECLKGQGHYNHCLLYLLMYVYNQHGFTNDLIQLIKVCLFVNIHHGYMLDVSATVKFEQKISMIVFLTISRSICLRWSKETLFL